MLLSNASNVYSEFDGVILRINAEHRNTIRRKRWWWREVDFFNLNQFRSLWNLFNSWHAHFGLKLKFLITFAFAFNYAFILFENDLSLSLFALLSPYVTLANFGTTSTCEPLFSVFHVVCHCCSIQMKLHLRNLIGFFVYDKFISIGTNVAFRNDKFKTRMTFSCLEDL